MTLVRFLLCGFAAAALVQGQPEDPAYRRMLESKKAVTGYLNRRARAITDHAAAEIQSSDTWDKVRARRLEEMRDMLGLQPWPERTPLDVKVTGTLDRPGYTIEKIVFESMPKFYVTGNLYIPKNRKGRVPAVIYVCGHAGSPYGAKTQYQRHGISFAKNGYVAFILDPIQIAEIFSPHHGVYSEEMYDWYSRGYTPAGVETWNAMRAIDYLETRAEVDKNRIGMTGRSGGAAMSWFTAAVDPRVKVVAPIMGISTYAANLPADTEAHHCDCMFPINTYMHDMMHQAALIAPRPLLFGEGKQDRLFPVPGYMEVKSEVGKLYRTYRHADEFQLVEVDTGHQDSDFLREQVMRWFDKYLMDVPRRQLDMAYANTPDEQLTVFGGKPPADARNGRVWEYFTTRPPSSRYKSLEEWNRRRAELTPSMHNKVFQAMPGKLRNVRLEDSELISDDTVPVRVVRRVPAKKSGAALLYVASDGEDDAYISTLLLRGLNVPDTFLRMTVFPRGIGAVPWNKTFWKATLRNAMQVGETVDSMRITDVRAAIELLAGADAASEITVVGKGVSGALGLYAAIYNPKVTHVVLLDPPVSHAEGPILLNVMRYTDLPEAAALFAPRRLTFYGRMPAAYEYTRHVWQLYGKAEAFETTVQVRW
jgi:cephalosporin-C deacetylase-like acetyl esterase